LFLKLWAEDPNHVPSIEARHELARLVSTALSKSQASALKWMTLKVADDDDDSRSRASVRAHSPTNIQPLLAIVDSPESDSSAIAYDELR